MSVYMLKPFNPLTRLRRLYTLERVASTTSLLFWLSALATVAGLRDVAVVRGGRAAIGQIGRLRLVAARQKRLAGQKVPALDDHQARTMLHWPLIAS